MRGLYAIGTDGALGSYDDGNQFSPDTESSQALGEHVRQLLSAYLADPIGNKYRIGVIYSSPEPKPWGSDTFLLETSVVRELYPVGGPPTQELTTFQKKNREKSIFRAMELLLEYRYDTVPDDPVFCPLLYDAGTSLQDYPQYAGFAPANAAPIPIVEVLNLIPTLPLGRRSTSAITRLVGRVQQYVVRKDKRRDGNLSISDRHYVSATGSGDADFFDVDKRHERQQTLEEEIRRRVASAAETYQADRFGQIEQWLERPHRPVDAALMRSFTQFRDLDIERLLLLAEKALVHTAPSGAKLLDIGMTDAWNMYLLEGTVSLHAADGQSLVVKGGDSKAANPISFLKPRKYNVVAVTSVSFLWIHDALLHAVLTVPTPPPRSKSTDRSSR